MDTKDLLHKHNLVRTSCRESIIGVMLQSGVAVSEEEIKSKVEGNYDRTTFYRTFKTLISSGIVHKIVVDNQVVKYALTETDNVDVQHIHFYCNECGQVNCIEGEPVPAVVLPEGYKPVQAELLVKGLCKNCSHG